MGVLIAILIGLGIFVLVTGVVPSFLRFFSPKVNDKNIYHIGMICKNILGLKNKKIRFEIRKDILYSKVRVNKRYTRYTVYIADVYCSKRVSTLIHELTHIQKGHSDMVVNFNIPILNQIINLYFDALFANINELRYFNWARKNCV